MSTPLGLTDSQYNAVVSACRAARSSRPKLLPRRASGSAPQRGAQRARRRPSCAGDPACDQTFFRPPVIGEQPRHNSKVGEPIA